ncbi:uncharacterized protein LOC143468316 isoform X2 [Clavelina lepadiformis]|uniref:uncharacterized protein LOC143468316 isoform X2 n=1 Tax=Clavelina lepadiformis TaxID=159417 RepID=UPI004042256C
MAEEDDETFPPEAQKLPTEFAFREFANVTLNGKQDDCSKKLRNNLLAVGNIYGLIFVGYSTGFKVYSDKSLFGLSSGTGSSQLKALVDVPLKAPPHWIAISSDNLTLAVCGLGEKGLQILFFDTRNLINSAKPAKTPFVVFPLSKSSTVSVVSLHWNPSQDIAHYLAICLSSGSFHMLSVTDSVKEIGQKGDDFGACAVCWSPRGKQVMIGKADGSMQQFTPTLEIRRTIPVFDAIEGQVKVEDILWLSTLQIALSYVLIGEDAEEAQASIFIASLPPAKDQTKTPSFRNYEDPCYGVPGTQRNRFFMSYLGKWNMFVLSSSIASETAVIAKNKQAELWEIWNLDDSCRAQLPLEEGQDEPSPLGVDVILTAKDRIVIDDTRECGPMPVFAMLSCDGQLSMFHMINLLSEDDYPKLVFEPKTLSPDGERTAVTSILGSVDSSASASSILGGKPKLTSKPSLLVATSTPKLKSELKMGESFQFMTPLQGGPGARLSATPPPSFAPKALTFSQMATPQSTKLAMPSPLKEKQNVAAPPPFPISSSQPQTVNLPITQASIPPTTVQTKPVSSKPVLGKTTSVAIGSKMWPSEPVIGVPGNMKRLPSKLVEEAARPESRTSTVSNNSTRSKKSFVPKFGQLADSRERHPSEKVQREHSIDSGNMMDSVAAEILDFEQELAAFINESVSVKAEATSLGDENSKVQLNQRVKEMSSFQREITKTTSEQHGEIQSVRNLSLEAFAALQNVETRRKRIENPAYRDALVSRPLDITDQKKIKDIRNVYQYVKEAIRDTNAVLDEQWHNYIHSQKQTPLRKSKRRIEMDERSGVHKAITTQTKILHDQEMKIMLLSQQLDRLRLLNTTYQLGGSPSIRTPSSKAAGDSADLPTLANVLIRNKSGNQQSPNTASGDGMDKLSPSRSGAMPCISPKKASQLADLLATRKSTVRSSSGGKGKSKFVAPAFRRRQSDARTASPSLLQSPSAGFPSVGTAATKASHSFSTVSNYSSESENDEQPAPPGDETYSGGLDGDYDITPKVREKFDQVPSNTTAKTQNMLFGTPSPFSVPLKKFDSEKPSVTSIALPQSTSIEGSSTITYGGPETPVAQKKQIPKFDVNSQTEASSNLNNPPRVVNIKELKDPQVVNVVPFSHKFQAKADVPQGVADEVQKVLNAVHAETEQKPTQSLSMLNSNTPSTAEDSPVTSETITTKSQGLGTISTSQSASPGMSFGFSSLGKTSSPFTLVKPRQPSSQSSQSSAVPPLFSTSLHQQTASLPSTTKVTQALAYDKLKGFGGLGMSPSRSAPTLFGLIAGHSIGSKKLEIPQTEAVVTSSETVVGAEEDKAETPESEKEQPALSRPQSVVNVSQDLKADQTDAAENEKLSSSDEVSDSNTELKLTGISSAEARPSTPSSSVATNPATLTDIASQAPGFSFSLKSDEKPAHPIVDEIEKPSVVNQDSTVAPGVSTTTASSTTATTFGFGLGAETTPGFGFGLTGGTPSTTSITSLSATTTSSGLTTKSLPTTTKSLGFGTTTVSTINNAGFGFDLTTTTKSDSMGSGQVPAVVSTVTSGFGFGTITQTSTAGGFGFGVPSAQVTSSPFTTATTPAGSGLGQSQASANSSGPFSGGFGQAAPSPVVSNQTTSTTSQPTNLFQTKTTAAPVFGAQPFGSTPVSNASTGGFLSGLGSTPSQSAGNSNPFAAGSTAQSTDTKSLFGNTGSSTFGSPFGQTQTTSGPFGAKQPEQTSGGFGAFSKPAAAGFGGAAVFGSPPSFGAQPTFGGGAQFGGGSTFGSGFGTSSSTFGGGAAFGSSAGTAASTASGGFGSSGEFGSAANSSTPTFGALAGQSSGGFGSLSSQNTGSGFGASANQGGGGGFGALTGQGGGFGSPANQGGGFGSFGGQQSQGFGGQQSQGFGGQQSQGFGGQQSQGFGGQQSQGFGSQPQSKSSFSGWR